MNSTSKSRVAPVVGQVGGRAKSLALVAVLAVAAVGLGGCEHFGDQTSHSAGWTLLEPSQRHPILVSQQPHTMSLAVSRGSNGLSPSQRAQLYNFLAKYRGQDGSNSKLVISVPAGSANEVAAMHAVADMRPLLAEQGMSEASISVEPYSSEGRAQPPLKISYLKYVAEAPECGRWPENVASSKRNLNHVNFGCAQQHNLAMQVANPADLLGPRTMTPAPADRREAIYDKYIKGEPSGATRTGDERVSK